MTTPAKRKTAAEYDAEVAARVFGAQLTPAKRPSVPAPRMTEDTIPSERRRTSSKVRANHTSSSKKKNAPSTPRSSSKKRSSSAKKSRNGPATPKSSSKKKQGNNNTTTAKRRLSHDQTEDEQQNEAAEESSSRTSGRRRTGRPSLRLEDLDVPTDARVVDVNQLARLHGATIEGVRPSPIGSDEGTEQESDPEDAQGPKGYLTQKGLQTLKEYKLETEYVSGFTGATDKYVMIPLWNWCLQFVPIWMAPNLLTTMSLACGVACYFLFQYFSPDFLDVPPAWVFYLTSFLMFFYLILDGLDGKQARKTGSSSPLGQLFDHGCDSICCFLCGIFMSSTLQLGSHRSAAIVLFLHILPFYTSNWEEYCTGVMRFGAIGITEGQLFICFLLALTGYIGVDAWNTRIPLPDWMVEYSPSILKKSFSEPMECKFILIFIGTLGVLYQVFSSSMSVWAYHTLHSEERRTKKIYNKAKRMFFHFLTFMLGGVIWVFSPSTFMQDHPRIILLTIGTLFGYQVSRLIISRVTKDQYPFSFLNGLFLPYLGLILNCWIGEPLPTYPIAVSYLAFVVLVYAHFVVTTINQICDFLRIRCFSIPYPKNA